MLTYNSDNSNPRDELLEFDPDKHEYSFNGRTLRSVTTIVEEAFPKFDDIYWSMRKCNNDESKAEKLRLEWQRHAELSRNLGTKMHEEIENFYLYGLNADNPALRDQADSTLSLFLDFANQIHLKPYRTEWRIFYEECNIAGTLDFLAYDGEKFEIYDWKRSNKLIDAQGKEIKESRYKKFANAPLDHLPDTVYFHYALQVSIYRYILEQKYGIEVAAGHLGVFHPDNKKFHIIHLPYLRDDVIKLLKSI